MVTLQENAIVDERTIGIASTKLQTLARFDGTKFVVTKGLHHYRMAILRNMPEGIEYRYPYFYKKKNFS